MNSLVIESHRGLFYALFGMFEVLLLTAGVVLWSGNPRLMSGLDDAAGVIFWFAFLGLSIVSWLLRCAAPRVAKIGLITILVSFIACSLLTAVP